MCFVEVKIRSYSYKNFERYKMKIKHISFLALFIIIFNTSDAQWVQGDVFSVGIVYSLEASGNYIFAGVSNRGVYRSQNNGHTWVQTSLNNVTVLSLYANGSLILAGSRYNGLYRSTDYGTTWNITSLKWKDVHAIVFIDDTLYAGVDHTGGLFKSTNSGQNWIQLGNLGSDIKAIVKKDNIIIAGTDGSGIYYTTNYGENWQQTSLQGKNISSVLKSGDNYFAGTYIFENPAGGWHSTNTGLNWNLTSQNTKPVNSIISYNENIFIGASHNSSITGGFLVSSDNGLSWTEKNQGFSSIPSIYSLLITNNYIFAGTNGQSVWKRPLSQVIDVKNISSEIPTDFSLEQNYPNPFNSITNVKFQIINSGIVKIKVYDLLGKEVKTIVNEYMQPGTYNVSFDAEGLSSGVYFYRMEASNFTSTKKCVLLK